LTFADVIQIIQFSFGAEGLTL